MIHIVSQLLLAEWQRKIFFTLKWAHILQEQNLVEFSVSELTSKVCLINMIRNISINVKPSRYIERQNWQFNLIYCYSRAHFVNCAPMSVVNRNKNKCASDICSVYVRKYTFHLKRKYCAVTRCADVNIRKLRTLYWHYSSCQLNALGQGFVILMESVVV